MLLPITPLALALIWASVSEAAYHGGVFENLRFSRRLQGKVFITLWDLPLHRCMEACRYRPRCESFSFHRLWTRCELHENETTAEVVKKPGFVFRETALNHQEEETLPVCKECKWNEVCSPQSKTICSVQECGPPEPLADPRLVALGNTWGLMKRVRYACAAGSLDVGVSTCLASGLWSSVDIVCDCPADWRPFDGHCYLFSTEFLTWWESQYYCQHIITGGHLVYVESKLENAFLLDMIMKSAEQMTSSGDGNGLLGSTWTGGNDLQSEGTFVWGFSSDNQFAFTNWFAEEPNNGLGGDEDCVLFWEDFGYTWNDVPCSDSYQFICEFP